MLQGYAIQLAFGAACNLCSLKAVLANFSRAKELVPGGNKQDSSSIRQRSEMVQIWIVLSVKISTIRNLNYSAILPVEKIMISTFLL